MLLLKCSHIFLVLFSSLQTVECKPPHIVIIVADDLVSEDGYKCQKQSFFTGLERCGFSRIGSDSNPEHRRACLLRGDPPQLLRYPHLHPEQERPHDRQTPDTHRWLLTQVGPSLVLWKGTSTLMLCLEPNKTNSSLGVNQTPLTYLHWLVHSPEILTTFPNLLR